MLLFLAAGVHMGASPLGLFPPTTPAPDPNAAWQVRVVEDFVGWIPPG